MLTATTFKLPRRKRKSEGDISNLMRLEGKTTTKDAILNDNVLMKLRILHVAAHVRVGNTGLHIILQLDCALIEHLVADQTIVQPED
jgi:hypothetical protein